MGWRTFFVLALALGLMACQPQPKAGAASRGKPVGAHDLSVDEARGGHTLQRHVGRTDQQLQARLQHERNISAASSYTDRETAERAVDEALKRNQEKIRRWIERGPRRPNLVID